MREKERWMSHELGFYYNNVGKRSIERSRKEEVESKLEKEGRETGGGVDLTCRLSSSYP